MKSILFYFLYALLWIVTRLPLSCLYFLSFLFYPVVYYLIPYRKKIVFKNLRNSFPEWDEKEVRKTAKLFYRHFCDLFVESLVFSFLSENAIRKRFKFKNPELVNELFNKGKSIVLLMAHYGNWEWSTCMPIVVKHQVVLIYKPLRNKYFNNFLIKSRERFGAKTITMDKTLRYLTGTRKENIKTLSYFLADQRPRWAQIQYWTKFLQQDTPVLLGPEKIAGKFDMAVVFFKINPVKQGYYEAEFELLYEDITNTKELEMTKRYLEVLEKMITEKPEYWLWTHNRWKHEKEKFVPKTIKKQQ